MGVRGLKTLIDNNDQLLLKDYQLANTHLVIDACNLISCQFLQSQSDERTDLFGGDMVQYGDYVGKFFDNLKKCNITPILVLDGAQTHEEYKSKTDTKHERSLKRFQVVMNINSTGFGSFVLPATATNVFKSVAVDKGLKLVQCMFEADAVVAQLAHRYKCPILSNDSDFYLIDLPHGVIPIDLLGRKVTLSRPQAGQHEHPCIECDIFMQDHFIKHFKKMSQNCLPLLGVLIGNDFVPEKKFHFICEQLPTQIIYEQSGMRGRGFRQAATNQHQKIHKVLHFLDGKTREEAVNQICNYLPKENRKDCKEYIKGNLDVYDVPLEDDFEIELIKLYRNGFDKTFKELFPDKKDRDREFNDHIAVLVDWIKRAMEKSVLSFRFLELAHRNYLFFQAHIDDPQLPSAHMCQYRVFAVLLTLIRGSIHDKRPIIIYDRLGNSYEKKQIRPLTKLEFFGPLNYLIYQVPSLSAETRRAILLATFYCQADLFELDLLNYFEWLDPGHAEEFLLVKVLHNFADFESPGIKLWKHFRYACLLCILYYYSKERLDRAFAEKIKQVKLVDFMTQLSSVIKRFKYDRMPRLSKTRQYNLRLMHQITQLQCSLISYNQLNAFLGDTMGRIRSETWLNSCLIYNLAENLRDKKLKIPELPDIIHRPVRLGMKI